MLLTIIDVTHYLTILPSVKKKATPQEVVGYLRSIIQKDLNYLQPTHSILVMPNIEKIISMPIKKRPQWATDATLSALQGMVHKNELYQGVAITPKGANRACDIIFTLIKGISNNKGLKHCVITNNALYYSILSEDCFLYSPFQRNMLSRKLTLEDFKKKTDLSPGQWIDIKILTGSNELGFPGVKGIGVKKAERLLKEYGTVEELVACCRLVPGKVGRLIVEARPDLKGVAKPDETLSLGFKLSRARLVGARPEVDLDLSAR